MLTLPERFTYLFKGPDWYWKYNEEKNELQFWAGGVKCVRVLEFHGEAYSVALRSSPFSKGELEYLRRLGLAIWHEKRWEEQTYIFVDKGMMRQAGSILSEILEESNHANA